MLEDQLGCCDVAVVGAGHAGVEAALAAARLGCQTVIFALNLDMIANCPCNPSIGGTAKGHLVKEIDALGGEMGKNADRSFLQSRMLNRGKGPAVHSLRIQIDRRSYSDSMKWVLEKQKNLQIRQAEIVDILPQGEGWLLKTRWGGSFFAKAVVLATGTFLNANIFIGESSLEQGPDGLFPSNFLTESIQRLGVSTRRFKTGTPARVLRSSIDFKKLQVQEGDQPVQSFSSEGLAPHEHFVHCYIGWTNQKTKSIILDHLHRSPMYSGKIHGRGPRYCPSIEDKIVRFSEKERHQFFVEPCGLHTEEMYLQGLSTSFPEDVQLLLYQSIEGLEHVSLMRPAYAIEYDCVDPLQLKSTLEFLLFPGLFGAGQFNGSSGYEEAAAQGLIAGINAAQHVFHKEPFVLSRSEAYIGALIDDLVTKGTEEPYRMMTSRSEYRLLLRQDNAEERLTPLGRTLGLISDARWEIFCSREEAKKREKKRIARTILRPSDELNHVLVSRETTPIMTGTSLLDLLKRPQLHHEDLRSFDTGFLDLNQETLEQIEIEIKYEGYIKKQKAQVKEFQRLEKKMLPSDIPYHNMKGLSSEAKEKLAQVRPSNFGQASRISGVSPADLAVLLIWISQKERLDDNR